jgi:hypothetical protein
MSSCMDQDRPWEEQPSRDYHNEIRADRDAAIARAESAERKLAMAVRTLLRSRNAMTNVIAMLDATDYETWPTISEGLPAAITDIDAALTELEKADG